MRTCRTLLVLLASFLLMPSVAAHAFEFAPRQEGQSPPVDCDPDTPETEEFTLVSPGVFSDNPTFQALFTVYTCWSYTSPDWQWNADSLRAMANTIIVPADPPSEQGLAKNILDYFGIDDDPSSNSFRIRTVDTNSNEVLYNHFYIYIFDKAVTIMSSDTWISLNIAGGPGEALPVKEVIGDAFAHEWQHTCYRSWDTVDSHVVADSFDDTGSFSELCSMLSVYKHGWDHLGGGFPYDWSLVSQAEDGFHRDCAHAKGVTQGGDILQGCLYSANNHYNDWEMFAVYLNNVYSIGVVDGIQDPDELVYRWLRTSHQEGTTTVYDHDFVGLGRVLNDPDLDHYFPGTTTEHERVQEAFRSYGVAKFLNLQQPVYGDPDFRYQWRDQDALDHPEQDWRPQEACGFLQDVDGYCYNNIQVFPSYHKVSELAESHSGWVLSSDVWDCSGDVYDWGVPEFEKRRMIQVGSYATNYIVLEPAQGLSGTLSLRLRFLPEYQCMKCRPIPEDEAYYFVDNIETYAGDVLVAIDVVGYDLPQGTVLDPDGPNGLDRFGAYVTGIETRWVEPSALDFLDVSMENLGNGVDAVAVIISAVPSSPEAGRPTIKAVPYEYTTSMVPSAVSFWSGSYFNSVVFPADQPQWILGEMKIETYPAGSLEIQPGARVYFCSEESRIVVDGGRLTISGTEANPVHFEASNLLGYPNTLYDGLYVDGSDLVTVSYLDARDLVKLRLTDTVAALDHLTILPADVAESAVEFGLITAPSDVELEGGVLLNIGAIRLNGDITLSGLAATQRQEYAPLLAPYPFLETNSGGVLIESSDLGFLRTGLRAGPAIGAGPSVTLQGEVALSCLDPGYKSTLGIECLGSSAVTLDAVRIRDAATCISAQANSSLIVDNSTLWTKRFGVVVLGSSTGRSILLGDTSDPLHPGGNLVSVFPATTTDCEGIRNPSGQCLEHPELVQATRIYNIAGLQLKAENNMWGSCDQFSSSPPAPCETTVDYGIDCICEAEYFKPTPGLIDTEPHMCQTAGACPGPGGGFTIQVSSAEAREGMWPNPFNGTVTFACRESGEASRLAIYDVSGRRIASLKGDVGSEGLMVFMWKGNDEGGRAMGSGVYLYRLEGGSRDFQGKVTYVK